MIHGAVNNRREAVVSIRMRGPAGDEVVVRAVVDTGYSGSLTVSESMVNNLGLEFVANIQADLADRSILQFDSFYADVEWGGRWRRVRVSQVGEGSLLGMRLLLGHELTIAVVPGGGVTISPLPGVN